MRYLINAVRETYQRDVNKHQAFGWTVERKAAGMNGLIYRVQSDDARVLPYAVKISLRDERRRTIREFGAMTALVAMGLRHVVPLPLLFFEEPDGLPGDVLVMEWLEGEPLQAAPAPEDKNLWRAILITFADVHSLKYTPQIKLFPSVMSVRHPCDLLELIRERRNRLPAAGQIGCTTAEAVDNLLARIAQQIPMRWDNEPALCLSLCDANPTNMIFDKGEIRFVDWANSGWSDGAYDIADMLVQPAYIHLPEDHRIWIRKTYANMIKDKQAVERIQVYEKMMYFLWVTIMAQPLVGAGVKRMAGVKAYPLEHYERYQQLYWELANSAY